MRAVLCTAIVGWVVAATPSTADPDDCYDGPIWFTTGSNEADKHLCLMDWAVNSVVFDPPLHGSGSEGVCIAYVELLGEDDSRIQDELVLPEDGPTPVWFEGRWLPFNEVVETIFNDFCPHPYEGF